MVDDASMGEGSQVQTGVEREVEDLDLRRAEELFEIRAGRLATYQNVLLVVLAYYLFTNLLDGNFFIVLALLGVLFLNIASIWVLRYYRSLSSSSILFTSGVYISDLAGAASTGCVESQAIWGLAILPVLASSLFGTRGTIGWCVATLVGFAGLYGLGQVEALQELTIYVTRRERFVLCLTILASVSMSAYMTTSISARHLQSLRTQHAELEIDHLRAETSNHRKSRFLARMSHELRTPMNGLLGVTQHLLSSELSARSRQSIDIIQRCGENLLTMLNDALDSSKVDSSELAFNIIPVDLPHLLHDVHALFLARAKTLGIGLHLEVDRDCLWVRTDPTRIRQIVSNLVGNALRYSDSGDVTISMHSDADSDRAGSISKVAIAIEDQGIGMDDEQIARLFQSFEQVHDAGKECRGGTGLGLSISKRLVDGLKGRIDVQSAPGVGSKFTVELPVEQAQDCLDLTLSQVTGPVDDSVVSLAGLHILVVDDSEINLKVAQLCLHRLGIDVDVARNGLEAVSKCSECVYDAVFMDIRMPELNGLEATRKIRAFAGPGSQVPVIALTANAYTEDRKAALDAGMNAYVSKPFKREHIEDALRAVVVATSLSHSTEFNFERGKAS